jgi:transposase
MTHSYSSDITREQFEAIRPLLGSARKPTTPRQHDLYDLFCGVLYVLKSGGQWRMLPADLPDWRSVYAYFRKWSAKRGDQPSLLEEALKKWGWRGPAQPGAKGADALFGRGRAQRQACGHGRGEGL